MTDPALQVARGPHRRLFALHLAGALVLAALGLTTRAADTVFSGPQIGEKTTPFRTVPFASSQEGAERDPITENAGAPTALVFIHGIERSLVPLLRVIDEYGALRSSQIKTEIVFLAADRVAGEQRARAANQSLRLQSRVGLSLDGAEGPGNYGLNKDCLMTIVAARSNVVTANFALVQPGIADAPKIIAALAQACGDTQPPSVSDLSPRPADRTAGRSEESMRRQDSPKPAQDPFPGAVPTDDQLQFLLRRFIRATNDTATTDRILAEVQAHIRDKPDLKKQALDGWTRVLHFGDRYGNEYSRKVGRAFLESLQKPTP